MTNYKGKRVSVIGFGRSGKACVKLLLDRGAKVFVSEIKERNQGIEGSRVQEVVRFEELGVEFEFGKHSSKILNSGLIIVSPGVSLDLPIIKEARRRGIPVLSELEFATQFIPALMHKCGVGITGTNGKTTTAFLIQEVLKSANKECIVCGNMGVPVSSIVNLLVDKSGNSTIPIIEVSTFQLEAIDSFCPHIGILLNITPDHLDRHKNFKEYRDLKFKLFSNQRANDFAILNFDDIEIRKYLFHEEQDKLKAQKIFFSTQAGSLCHQNVYIKDKDIFWEGEKLFSLNNLNLKWECWLEDGLAAIAVAKILGIPNETILKGFRNFKGVPHRLEDIGVINGVRFINNSMCTNPDSFKRTLLSFKRRVILITGGKEKGVEITSIVNTIKRKAKHTILIGETSETLAKALKENYTKAFPSARRAGSMDEAVKIAFKYATKGDTILLSPGFASFDWFQDFKDRGEKFKKAIEKLKKY
ncbi:UDP-N-acetylmuramoyl-L-alanine--D-glutamate ligase [candidate division WOR-3 bacterium]|nr:UDP-N-acetylmuramoyl-L-alanine--D-glutamate ligase [candidate division WOR-3 bacterium]